MESIKQSRNLSCSQSNPHYQTYRPIKKNQAKIFSISMPHAIISSDTVAFKN